MRTKKFLIFFITTVLFIIPSCSNVTEPPEAIVKINDVKIEAEKGTYQWETKGLFSTNSVVADSAAPFQIAEHMKAKIVKPDSVANIEFSDGSKPQLNAYLWEGEEQGEEITYKKNQIKFPSQTGKHIIEILAKWPSGEAFYTFVIEVK